MTLCYSSTEQCINKLQHYADTKVHSWNPLTFFRKRHLKNHHLANDLANILRQTLISDNDLLKLARAIDDFEDSELQHELLCYLYSTVTDPQKPFMGKRQNPPQLTNVLHNLIDRQYKPWWLLYLIEIPYYSYSFQNDVKWLIGKISSLFSTRRTEVKHELITTHSNDEIVNQIINKYHTRDNLLGIDHEDELNNILEISLEQTKDQSQRVLLREIQRGIIKNLPFGKLLISVAGLSSIIGSYLSNNENQLKPVNVQAQEILYIAGKVFLKVSAAQIMKEAIPGIGEVAEAITAVVISQSPANPLHTDKKFGRAAASVAGGFLGGAIGAIVPVIGSPIGAYVGAVVSKTAATRFYQVLEAWQIAPKGPGSIIPCYSKSLFAVFDNDAKNILEPLYLTYLDTEKKSKPLGDEVAQWLSIYLFLQSSGTPVSEEHLEIINEEMNRLASEFKQLKDNHSKHVLYLYRKKPDNPERMQEYLTAIKTCLKPLQNPLVGMLNEYFEAPVKTIDSPTSNSYTVIMQDLPVIAKPITPIQLLPMNDIKAIHFKENISLPDAYRDLQHQRVRLSGG